MPNDKKQLRYIGPKREGHDALTVFDSGADKGLGPVEVGATYEFTEITAVDLLRDHPKEWVEATTTKKSAKKNAQKE